MVLLMVIINDMVVINQVLSGWWFQPPEKHESQMGL
jgi:hypothetical protein